MSARVLVVEDDPDIAELVVRYLDKAGYTTTRVSSGRDALDSVRVKPPDLLVLDLMLPQIDGLEVCRLLRASDKTAGIPIIMLTARAEESERIVGLEIGADDYLPKPFSPRELLARLKAVLRRAKPDLGSEKLAVGDLSVEVAGREVRVGGKVIELTGIEFDILLALLRRAGRVVPREALLSEAGRGEVFVSERTVDVHVSHLRHKLGDDPRSPKVIKTVRGVGYVLAKPA